MGMLEGTCVYEVEKLHRERLWNILILNSVLEVGIASKNPL
jgi:hypothetical protein